MPSSSAQVEVQAPPGLENEGGCRVHHPWLCGPSGNNEATSFPQVTEDQAYLHDLKQQLVGEVTKGVREHIEGTTVAAVDTLWQRGQHALQQLQQQQKTQMEQLQSQLAECTESYQHLERENAMLRTSLEALMKHLTIVFGTPPYMQPQSQHIQHPQAQVSPQFAQQVQTTASILGLQPDLQNVATESTAPPKATTTLNPSVGGECADAENFNTPPASPLCEGDSAATPSTEAPSADPDGTELATNPATLTPSAVVGSKAIPAVTFSIKLRRADQVPLGLDLQSDIGAPYLVVQAIRPGGAVEAWNRQCSGDSREIRPGDRIIMINGLEDPDSMGQECLTKYLLKVTVLRITNEPSHNIPLAASGLRADANEFVPQVGSLPN